MRVSSISVSLRISTAASPDGPRYDPTLISEARRHPSDGIWLCQNVARPSTRTRNSSPSRSSRKWKLDAERRSFLAVVAPGVQRDEHVAAAVIDAAVEALIARLGLPAADDIDTVATRLIAAAAADVAAFRRMAGWPRHALALNLRMTDDEDERAFQASGLAAALGAFNEISSHRSARNREDNNARSSRRRDRANGALSAAVSSTGRWASQAGSLLQSVLQRAAFQGNREQHLMLLAYHGGWFFCSMAGTSSIGAPFRASSEIKRLRREFPTLGIIVTTRRRARRAPQWPGGSDRCPDKCAAA